MTDVDAIVVGSGFGGSVAAYRLAKAGHIVLVLERGRQYPPGSFPRSPQEMSTNLWDPSEGLYGLFDIWSFNGLDAIVASGVGGGSLIYANVLLRKDKAWFVHEDPAKPEFESWPIGYDDLQSHYDSVHEVLTPEPYPIDTAPFTDLPKARAMELAARRLGHKPWRPDLAVTFGTGPGQPIDQPNMYGAPRETCRFVGECDIGCNFGSKNSLDLTYLSRAVQHDNKRKANAEIRDLSEVKSLKQMADGTWEVGYVKRFPESAGTAGFTSHPEQHQVRSKIVVLAAGSLGTTFLLLNNRANLPQISSRLGRQFSTNGDYLAFMKSDTSNFHPSRGPVITTAMRMPDAVDHPGPTSGNERGFYVEDGGYPAILDWLLEYALPAAPLHRVGRVLAIRWWQRLRGQPVPSSVSKEVSALLGSGARAAGILPILAMGRDVPGGRMQLRSGLLDVDWNIGPSEEYYRRLRDTLHGLAGALGVTYLDSLSHRLSRAITVHPVGGCPMGTNPATGVVNEWGQVFGYPTLFVADGSVMPGPVGPNPAFTIAAVADRCADQMTEVLTG